MNFGLSVRKKRLCSEKREYLGIINPEALLQSFFFYNRKNLHLRGGQEHRFLCISQFQCLTNPDRYVYVESGSKNHSGGLNDRS